MTEEQSKDGIWLTAVGLNKQINRELNILKNISLVIQPNEMVVIVGQSGSGKSTLMDALAGYRPASSGDVFINQIDVYRDFDAVRSLIGYVPQRDIIHMELTVYQALDYAAQLRMPRGTSKKERHQRVMEVLQELDLMHRKDVQVSGLSGGQQKRVSIGVELLTRPQLFFLDEPTSGLDPGTETALMGLLRQLADQGRTILLITHATKNIMVADKVVFLARGGYLAWFGPPDEALEFFKSFVVDDEEQARFKEFDDIYTILDNPANGSPQEWALRFMQHPAYMQYIFQNLNRREQFETRHSKLRDRLRQAKEAYLQQVRPVRQFSILSGRNIRILTRDRASLLLMLLAPVLVGSLDFLLSAMMGRDVCDFYQGAPVGAVMTLFLLSLYTMMVAGLSQMREFVKETHIYRRERLVNLRLFPYVASKVWVAALLSLYHAAVYTTIRYQAFDMPGDRREFWMIYVTLLLSSFAGMMLGLLASAIAPNAGSAPMVAILLIVPNIVLSGALVPLPEAASTPATTFWTFKSLVSIVGIGSDVAADDCWDFPDDLRSALTLDDKIFFDCHCMGVQMFDQEKCNFPGNGNLIVPEITESMPEKPAPLRDPPVEPQLPPAPPEPEDPYDRVQVAEYLNAITEYQEEVAQIQETFKQEMEAYKLESSVYQTRMIAYQNELSRWYVARSAAAGAAEGNIRIFRERFGWAFVDKDDEEAFIKMVTDTWIAQGVIVLIFLIIILVTIKMKDRNL